MQRRRCGWLKGSAVKRNGWRSGINENAGASSDDIVSEMTREESYIAYGVWKYR